MTRLPFLPRAVAFIVLASVIFVYHQFPRNKRDDDVPLPTIVATLVATAASSSSPSPVVFVTGANQGIGFGVVHKWCEADAVVVFSVRSEEKGRDTTQRLPKGCRSRYVVLDVTDNVSVDIAITTLRAMDLGGISYAIHNQGISEGDAKPKKWRGDVAKHVIDVNWFGTQRMFNALMPLMAKKHHILFTSSDHGQLKNIIDSEWREMLRKSDLTVSEIDALMNRYIAWAAEHGTKTPKYATSAYALTKVAIVQYARVLARDTPGLVVNAIHPGYIKTVHNGWRGKMTPEWAASYILQTCKIENVTGRFMHRAKLFSAEK